MDLEHQAEIWPIKHHIIKNQLVQPNKQTILINIREIEGVGIRKQDVIMVAASLLPDRFSIY